MFVFFSSRRRHTRYWRDWSSDVCSSDLGAIAAHGMGGIWGTLSCGLFTTPALAAVGEPGLFYGGGFYQLGIQALGIVACGGFVFLPPPPGFPPPQAPPRHRGKTHQEADGPALPAHGGFGFPPPVA